MKHEEVARSMPEPAAKPSSPAAAVDGPRAANPSSEAPSATDAETKTSDPIPADTATPAKTEKKENGEAKDEKPEPKGTGVSARVDLTNSTAENIKVIGQEIKSLVVGDVTFGAPPFSLRFVESTPLPEEERQARRHICDEGIMEEFIATLRDHRMLIASGDPYVGKGSTAVYLAYRLRQRDAKLDRELAVVKPLSASVLVNLGEVARDRNQYGKRVIFFKDFLSRHNRTLRDFIEQFDEVSAAVLRRDLENNDSYLIFTTDVLTLGNVRARLEQLGVCLTVPTLGPQSLAQGLDQAVNERGIEGLTPQEHERILLHCETMPRILRFVNEYVVRNPAKTVDDVLLRLDNTPLWMEDLAEDFDLWSFAFVLGLAYAVDEGQGVPWVELEGLRTALIEPIRKWAGTPQAFFLYKKDRLSDTALLSRIQCTIQRDVEQSRDFLMFEEESRPRRMWSAFLKHNRRLLSALLPLLQELAEGDRFDLRIHAARILGRIGEIDPSVITISILRRWSSSSSSDRTHAAAGHLMMGVLSSTDETYRKICLEELEAMCKSQNESKLWTAIAGYKQIGKVNLSLALARLKDIAEAHLVPRLLQTNDIFRLLREVIQRFEKELPFQLTWAPNFLERLVCDVMNERLRLLFAIKYAVVALCISVGPIEVFGELRKWLRGSDGLRALTSLLYLQSNGIADELSNWTVNLEVPTNGTMKKVVSSPMLVALTGEPAAPIFVATFLEDIFASFNTVFPLEAVQYLTQTFFTHIRASVVRAADYPQGRKALEDLFVRLISSPISDLKAQTLDLLRTHEVFAKAGSSEQEFAAAVLKRGLNAPTRRNTAKSLVR